MSLHPKQLFTLRFNTIKLSYVFQKNLYQCRNQSAPLHAAKDFGIDPLMGIPDDVLIGWGDLSSL